MLGVVDGNCNSPSIPPLSPLHHPAVYSSNWSTINFIFAGCFFFFRWIKQRRTGYPLRVNFAVLIGAFLVTLVTYGVFVLSFDLMLWILSDVGLKNGYGLFILFTAPFFLIILCIDDVDSRSIF